MTAWVVGEEAAAMDVVLAAMWVPYGQADAGAAGWFGPRGGQVHRDGSGEGHPLHRSDPTVDSTVG